MKVIIAGSRSITDYYEVVKAVNKAKFDITEIVSGTARGVDRMSECYAREHNIALKRFPADWSKHGKSAGPLRNIEMANYADALILVWDGVSRGSKHMRDTAEHLGLQVYVHTVGA